MADRSKRPQSAARPGQVIIETRQKRRTKDEIEADKAKAQVAKEEKRQQAQKKHNTGVVRVAVKEDEIRRREQEARLHSARPDLLTAAAQFQRDQERGPADLPQHSDSDQPDVTSNGGESDNHQLSDSMDIDVGPEDTNIRFDNNGDDGDDDEYVASNKGSDSEGAGDESDESQKAAWQEFLKARDMRKRNAKEGKESEAKAKGYGKVKEKKVKVSQHRNLIANTESFTMGIGRTSCRD